MKKSKYTFICEYRKGTYISQYKAENLDRALHLWILNLTYPPLSTSEKRILEWKINEPDWFPVAIKEIDNVWCSTFTIKRSFLLLNIIETV